MFESVEHVDWELLHDQKRMLVQCLEAQSITPSGADLLWGLVNFLDALQDDAESAGHWTHPDVDPP